MDIEIIITKEINYSSIELFRFTIYNYFQEDPINSIGYEFHNLICQIKEIIIMLKLAVQYKERLTIRYTEENVLVLRFKSNKNKFDHNQCRLICNRLKSIFGYCFNQISIISEFHNEN